MKVIPSAGEGQRLFQQKGCIGCHSVDGKGGKVGPSLDDVGLRRTPEWMMQHFRDPQSVTPGSVMPQFGFTETEARALTEFLLHLREQNVALEPAVADEPGRARPRSLPQVRLRGLPRGRGQGRRAQSERQDRRAGARPDSMSPMATPRTS